MVKNAFMATPTIFAMSSVLKANHYERFRNIPAPRLS